MKLLILFIAIAMIPVYNLPVTQLTVDVPNSNSVTITQNNIAQSAVCEVQPNTRTGTRYVFTGVSQVQGQSCNVRFGFGDINGGSIQPGDLLRTETGNYCTVYCPAIGADSTYQIQRLTTNITSIQISGDTTILRASFCLLPLNGISINTTIKILQ